MDEFFRQDADTRFELSFDRDDFFDNPCHYRDVLRKGHSPELHVALDDIIDIGPVTPQHLIEATRSLLAMPSGTSGEAEPSLDVPQARTGFVLHPKGMAPIKFAANGDSKTIGDAPNGSPVQVIEKDGDWYRVEVGGTSGYMHYSWVRVNQFDEPGGGRRFVQVKSFSTLAKAQAYVRQSAIPLSAHLAANGWIAVTLHDVYGEQEAKDLSNSLKERGLISGDAFVTFGNTYVRKLCCD